MALVNLDKLKNINGMSYILFILTFALSASLFIYLLDPNPP